MQKTQNADIQRVMNLVDFYRTKVRESDAAKDAQMEYEDWCEFGVDQTQTPNDTQWEWVKILCVNEQLLGHFYSVVAGDKAEKDILQQLLPEAYDTSIFTQEEEDFLKEHFKELVNYIIQTPDNVWSTKYGDNSKGRETFLIPEEVLELIKSRVNVPDNAVIYNPFAWFGQLATLFKSNTVFWGDDCDLYGHALKLADSIHDRDTVFHQRMLAWMKSWAWARIAMYVNKVNARLMKHAESSVYDVLIAHIHSVQERFCGEKEVKRIHDAYCHLKEGGKMVLLCPNSLLWKDSSIASLFMAQLVKDGSIVEIIQLPSVVPSPYAHEDFCIMIADKGRNKGLTTFIDAQDAFRKKTELSTEDYVYHIQGTLDMEAWNALLQNGGIKYETGLRKIAQLESVSLNPNMLLPQVCVLEKPSESENPISLSKLCNLVTKLIRNVGYDLPIDTPWVEHHNLSRVFQGALDVTLIKTANCPNIPPHTEEYEFKESGEFIEWSNIEGMGLSGQKTEKGERVVDYRRCTFIDGTKDAVLLNQQGDGVSIALIRATGKPVAIDPRINVFIPNDDIDALSLVALLKLPIVYRQIRAYDKFGLSNYMDDILVPTDLRIIRDEEQRMLKVGNAISELEEKLANQKKSVRMRKHALTQSLSSIEAMFDALNAYRIRKKGSINDRDIISRVKGTTVREVFDFLAQNIKDMMPALEHIADVEYTFRKPEWIDPEIFIEDYIFQHENGWLNFKPIMTWENGHNVAKEDIKNPSNGEIILQKGQSINQFFFPTDALEHVFKNIISNAQAWAFDDQSREDYQLKFSWQMKGTALIIEIENNGTPIPRDRDTASLLEYGVSTALHHDGHNGIGCNEIDDIMQRYDGKVEIVSTPEKEFTVKYILTFNRSNTGRTF